MYGLKQSPNMWQHFLSVASSVGFSRLKSDSNFDFLEAHKVYMLCYIDDLLLFGPKGSCEFLFAELQKQLCLRQEGIHEPGKSMNQLPWSVHHSS